MSYTDQSVLYLSVEEASVDRNYDGREMVQ